MCFLRSDLVNLILEDGDTYNNPEFHQISQYFDLLNAFPNIPPTAVAEISGEKKLCSIEESDDDSDNKWKYDYQTIENIKYLEELRIDKEDEGYDFLAFVTKEQCVEVSKVHYYIFFTISPSISLIALSR